MNHPAMHEASKPISDMGGIATKIVFVLLLVVWFALLGHRDLFQPDEGRYAEIPREMVASGDWLTPRLNNLKYFEKPALQYWITAINYELFGVSNTSARLWLAMSGFLCALFTAFVAGRLYNRKVGYYTLPISLSMFIFTILGHLLTLDMSMTMFMTLGIGSLLLAQKYRDDPGKNRWWMLVGWFGLAGAILTKGLIGIVLPGAAIFVYILWQRDWKILARMHLVKGTLLLLVLTAPWFIAVSMANDEFAHFFFIHEHFQRFTTTVHHRAGPLYYFIPIFLLGVSPWLVASIKSLVKPGFEWKVDKPGSFNPERLIWVYITVIFLFFSLSHSKLPTYILPIFPFVAMLVAKRFEVQGTTGADKWTMVALTLVVCLLAAFITKLSKTNVPVDLLKITQPWFYAAAFVLALGTFALFKWVREPFWAVSAASISSILAFQIILWGMQGTSPYRSARIEAEVIKASLPTNTTIYSVKCYPQALPFYLQKTITMVEIGGELSMGINSEPHKWIPSVEKFLPIWKKQSQAAAIMRKHDYHTLKKKQFPMVLIHEGPKWVVVKRR